MARLLLFATARQAAGTSSHDIDADTLGDLMEVACLRFGSEFAAVLSGCRVWVNGDDPTGPGQLVTACDEIAVIPPVAGG